VYQERLLKTTPKSSPDLASALRNAVSAVGLAAMLAAVLGAGAPAAHAQQTLTFSADRTQSVFAEGRERIELGGNARVESDDFLITAAEIEIFGDGQRYVRAVGGAVVYDRENDMYLSSDEFFLDREGDFLRANGNAYMEDRPSDLVVKGGTIQNWDELDLTEISVNVRILGEDYTARGQFARYRREGEILELSGTPEVFWKGDEYRATRIRIDLANDEIEFVGDVRAVVRQDADEPATQEGDAPEETTSDE
jgi:lipopolysaccharide export system protein LptA